MSDAGSRDAGIDAGETDAGLPNSDVLTLFASTDDEERVRLVWDAGMISASSISVFRDNQLIATVSGVASYDDFDASSGSLGGIDAGATIGLPSGIELEWTVPSSEPGALISYRIRADVDGGELESNEAIGQRTAPSVVEWMVEAGGRTSTVPASQTRWLDTSAPSPIVILGSVTATAVPDDETSSVVLSADASVQRTPQPVTYTVTARPSSGPSVFAKATGERGGLRPEYQWQRSTADSRDAGWVDLPYVHGRRWFDAEAVFNEGRYYRVVLRSGAQQSISDEPRALLWRPRAFGMAHGSPHIQRDDGFVMRFGSRPQQVQFEPSAQFVVVDHGPCLLLADAGVECLLDDGTVQAAGLPPATRLYGGRLLCASVSDGGVQCLGRPGLPSFDIPGLVTVVDSALDLFCGERPADAGIRCESLTSTSFDVSPRPLALRAGGGVGSSVMASYPDGVVMLPSGTPVSMPIEDAGYVQLASAGSALCGIRDDGQLRCTGSLLWGFSPPIGVELFESFKEGCGLTRDHRLRCVRDTDVRSLPPRPPIRQVRVFDGAYYLLETGLLAGRGPVGGPSVLGAGPAFLDRFVQLAGGADAEQCALRVDQSATCWGNSSAPVPPSMGRYRKLVQGYGLNIDGGVDSWRGLTDMAGATDLVDVGNAYVCGRFPDDHWTCSPPLPVALPAGRFSMVVANRTSTCALEDGKVECWPDPPPAHALGRRYRHLAGGDNTNITCGVTVEGEVSCWQAGMAGPFPFQIPWDDFVTFEWSRRGGCGVRRDGTAACVGGVFRMPWD